MSVLYITDQGATITKTDGRVVIRKENRLLEDLPARDIERIIIFGNVNITTPAMKFFLSQGIDVCLLSSHGRYKGRLQGEFCKDVETRKMQYMKAADQNIRLVMSKAITTGKLKNMVKFLKRQKMQTPEVKQAIKTAQSGLERLEYATNQDTVRGYEGSSASAYYRGLSSLLKKEFRFQNRSHYPPQDKTNVLLSLGYTLLYNTVYSEINIVGLDPYQGFLHASRHGHATLASDMMEEFRSIIVDSVVLRIINKKKITNKDFTRQGGKIKLGNDGLKRILTDYENRLRDVVKYPGKDKRLNYLQCIEEQLRHFVRVITEKEKTYMPFIVT